MTTFPLSANPFFLISQLRNIRHCLYLQSATILANSLVSSKLDYCNALLFGLPNKSIPRLHRVQNSLARVLIPSTRRFDHINPVLRRLHWLPIAQRISFKIATITFKVLNNPQPSYLLDLLHPYKPSRSLCSSDQSLLLIPRSKTAAFSRAFSHYASTLWNSLPHHIRTATSLAKFRSLLKTHLYPP